ncbi:hypothetical protein DBR32_01640 [Taibaiella sp. KBW10]|nr:hypothetical protein DBR32_01640 [Taibaiella sp. KBW10]
MQVFAQQATTANSKEYNVYYTQDIPYVDDQASNKKMEQLDKMFKDYVVVAQKNQATKTADLKNKIMSWKTDNQTWIEELDAFQSKMVKQWFDNAAKSLRLYDNK